MSLINALAEAACKIDHEAMSPEILATAKLRVLDGIGVGIHGSTLRPLFDPLIHIYRDWGGEGPSSVFGESGGFAPRYAAAINSVVITASAFQETHRSSLAHPYSPVMSTALAVGEAESASGRDFLLALVAGYEVYLRVATAVNPSFMQRGLQTTGGIAPFGAAAVCGKLYGFSQERMEDAIAHAANFGGAALIEAHGAKPYFAVQVGVNVEKGILAALLARNGVVGCDTNLEGGSVHEKGFLQAHTDSYDTKVIEKGFDGRLGIEEPGYSFYLVASFSRTPIDATLSIVRENRIAVEDIHAITVKLTHTLFNFTQRKIQTADQSAREAYYFIPFHLALALLKGGVDDDMYTDENLNSPEIRQLMEKVAVVPDPELDAEFGESQAVTTVIVEIRTRGGKEFSQKLSRWKGDPENPATKEEIQEKFRKITSKVLTPSDATKIMDQVENLDSLRDIRELGRLIRR